MLRSRSPHEPAERRRLTARRRSRTTPEIPQPPGNRLGACAGCGCWPRRIRRSANSPAHRPRRSVPAPPPARQAVQRHRPLVSGLGAPRPATGSRRQRSWPRTPLPILRQKNIHQLLAHMKIGRSERRQCDRKLHQTAPRGAIEKPQCPHDRKAFVACGPNASAVVHQDQVSLHRDRQRDSPRVRRHRASPVAGRQGWPGWAQSEAMLADG